MRERRPAPWSPILFQEDAVRAIDAARAIADDLAAPTATTRAHAHEIALLHAYLGLVLDDDQNWKRAQALLGQAVDRVAHEGLGPSLYGGFAGIGWVVEHIG